MAQSNRGQQLLASGRAGEAAEIFGDILETLGDQPSYNRALTLDRLGRCYRAGSRADLAEATYRQSLAVTEQLEPNDEVKRKRGALRTDLADAVKRYHEALELFQRLGEPEEEAVSQHPLGVAFQKAGQWEQAEQHYRESARLEEQRGNLAGAARTWNQLATVNESAGKPEAAETWYRKAIDGGRQTGDRLPTSRALYNLANLQRTQPGRLDEARELAEEALAIMKTLDPGAAEIWTTCNILAGIADQQSQPDRAAEYRQLAREAKRNFAGTAHEMKRHHRSPRHDRPPGRD